MTQKIKNIMLGIIAVAALSLASCKKSFLELRPPTSLTPQIALASESDLGTALLGAYSGLRNVELYGRTVPLLGDLMADNAYQSLQNSNRYPLFNTYTFTQQDGNVSGFWNSAYNTILRCNNIINSSIAANTNVNQIKGEAYAIRALAYFTLVRYFARPFTESPDGLGVPIITAFDVTVFPSRSKVSEVYTLINADLTQAFTLMTVYKNSTQFSKYAARGLQAKVYLTMGDKTNAKTAALDVISNGGFSVVTAANYLTYWNSPLPRTDKVETLFEVSSDANNNNGFDALPNIYSQSGYGDYLASDEFFPSVVFSSGAATGTVTLTNGVVTGVTITNGGSGYTTAPTVTFSAPPFTGVRATGTAVITNGVITGVTITNGGSGYSQLLPPTDIRRVLYASVLRGGLPSIVVNKFPNTFGTEVSDTKVLRMSEMYLIAAEASLPGNEADALTYVNYITSRRNAAAITSTGAQLFEDIITERRRELAFEGDRYLDLQRLKRDVVRSVNYPSAARLIAYSNFRRILPIPQTEVDANPAIKTQQNPGYN